MDVPHTSRMNPRPDSTPLTSALDEAFMARVHKTSLLVAGLVSASAAVYTIGGNWALGFLSASLWSIANLWMLERLVRMSIRPGNRDRIAIAVGILIKLPLLHALLILLVFKGGFNATALAAGVSVPLFVIVLKVAGRLFVTRMRASGPGLPEPRS